MKTKFLVDSWWQFLFHLHCMEVLESWLQLCSTCFPPWNPDRKVVLYHFWGVLKEQENLQKQAVVLKWRVTSTKSHPSWQWGRDTCPSYENSPQGSGYGYGRSGRARDEGWIIFSQEKGLQVIENRNSSLLTFLKWPNLSDIVSQDPKLYLVIYGGKQTNKPTKQTKTFDWHWYLKKSSWLGTKK